jgi:hypothetical protein
MASMSSTANAVWQIPGVFAGTSWFSLSLDGEWNFVNSSRLWPSGVWIMALSAVRLNPHDAVHPATLDGPLALQHESKLDKTQPRLRGRQLRCRRAPFV